MLLNQLITQSMWIACLKGFTCNRSSPTEPASKYGSKSERARCKNVLETLRDYIAFMFAVLITSTVYWLDYRKLVLSVSLLKGRGKLIKLLKVKSETERKTGASTVHTYHELCCQTPQSHREIHLMNSLKLSLLCIRITNWMMNYWII